MSKTTAKKTPAARPAASGKKAPAAKTPAAPAKKAAAAPAKKTPAAKTPVAAKKAAPAKPAPVKSAAAKSAPAKTPPAAVPPTPPVPAKSAAPKKAATPTSMPKVSAPSPVPAPAAAAPSRPAPAPAARVVIDPSLLEARSRKVDPKLANVWKSKAGRELSDDEVLAMPDAEYMNDKQQDFFRAKLEALKDDLLSNAGETTEHLREDTSIVPDPADRATIEEEHALELRTRDRERKLLKKITQALARIDSGDYGFCDETGEPIGLGRLIARPTATLTLEAQQRRELKQKMYGD